MNVRCFTGYLMRDATTAWAPATAEHGPLPRLVFEVMITDSQGVVFPDKCVVDQPKLVAEYEPLLTAGRAVIVEGEQTARAYHKHGVLEGYVRETRVFRMEFPNRARARREGEETAAQPQKATV